IVADPEEDTPRLVYADWLEENGDAGQAEFIREAIAHERSLEANAGKFRHPEHERGLEWLKALGLPHAEPHRFERGLPAMVIYWSPTAFFEEAEALFARTPVHDLGILWQSGKSLDFDVLEELAAMP